MLTYDTAWNLLAECTLDGREVGKYINGQRTDEILVSNLKSQVVYPLADGQGNTVALTSVDGSVIERQRYNAYGQPQFMDPSHQTRLMSATGYRFLFTGREWIASVGLSDHRNRYYSFGLGRWLSSDLIRLVDGVNLYAFVLNSPIIRSDPSGLVNLCCIWEDAVATTNNRYAVEAWATVATDGSQKISATGEVGAAEQVYQSRADTLAEALANMITKCQIPGSMQCSVAQASANSAQLWFEAAKTSLTTAQQHLAEAERAFTAHSRAANDADFAASLANFALTLCEIRNIGRPTTTCRCR